MLAVVSILLPWTASAGSPGNPEVVDPSGDEFDPIQNQHVDAPNSDVLSGWFEERGDDRFEVHFRLQDINGAFRDGTNSQVWNFYWDEPGGRSWRVSVFRDSTGANPPFATLDSPGDTAINVLAAPTLDQSKNEIAVTVPRSFSIAIPNGTATETAVVWEDGTTFVNPLVRNQDGLGSSGCSPCNEVDTTAPGSSFTFKSNLSYNRHVTVRPTSAIVAAEPGRDTTISFTASSPPGIAIDLTTDLLAKLSIDGWRIDGNSLGLSVLPGKTSSLAFTVHVPASAKPGEMGLLTIDGGDVPVSVLVVVGKDEAEKVKALQLGPDFSSTPAASTLHLVGVTVNSASEPVVPGDLVRDAPKGTNEQLIARTFASTDAILPFGTWRTLPLENDLTLSGPLELAVDVDWTNTQGTTLLALVGPDPLPLDWDGITAPAGTVKLVGTAQAATNARAFLKASGTADDFSLARGDALSVAIFVAQSQGTGSVQLHIFTLVSDSRLNFTYLDKTLAPIEGVALPGGKNAIYLTGSPAPLGLMTYGNVTGLAVGPSGETVLSVGSSPRAAVVGDSSKKPASDTTSDSFLRSDATGTTKKIAFDIGDDVQSVNVRLSGQHAAVRTRDTNIDLEVYRLGGTNRTIVKASRANGPEENVTVSRADLEKFGRGPYEADVILKAVGPTSISPTVTFDITVTKGFSEHVPDALVENWLLWDYSGEPAGNYSISARRGASPAVASAPFLLTSIGPTLPPVAGFVFSPILPAVGDSVNFADVSADPDGRIVSWSWDFGDGAKSDQVTPTHTYAAAGNYPVVLVVTDDFGAVSSASVREVTIVASQTGLPTDGIPSQGTLGIYKDLYAKGLTHVEAYTDAWLGSEISGAPGREYLPGRGVQAYVHGTSLNAAVVTTWNGGTLSLTNLLGGVLGFDRGEGLQSLGEARVRSLPPKNVTVNGGPQELQGFSAAPQHHDDANDGLLMVELSHLRGTLNAKRTLTFLEGTLHGDVRNVIRSSPGDTLNLTTETVITAPSGSWLAHASGATVHTLRLVDGEAVSVTFDAGNGWFAVYRPTDVSVAGVVFSGDARSATATLSGALLRIRTDYEAVGSLLSAQYILAYDVADTDATRYAGVMEIAHQDEEEIGTAVLADDRAAAVGWAGARSTMEAGVASGLAADWTALNGFPMEWDLRVEAPSTQGGEAVRLILPAHVLADGSVAFTIDGAELSLSKIAAMSDDVTLVALAPIDHFSVRSVQVRSVVPGLAPIFLWATLGLGAIVSAEALVLARQALGGGAAARGTERFGAGTQSAAVRRALGYAPDDEGPSGSGETREVKGIIAGDRERMTSDRLPSGAQSDAVRKALGMDAETQAAKAALLAKLAGPAAPSGPKGPDLRPAEAKCSRCGQPVAFAKDAGSATCAACGAMNTRRET